MADGGDSDSLGFLGLLGAAAIASAGAIYNNRQQAKFQKSTNDTAISLANTAHQREVEDLRLAGLNPILSATGSGAPTPSLGTPNLDNVLDGFGSNARGIGEMLSKQRSLSNDSLKLDNDARKLENRRNKETLSSDINSAKALADREAVQAQFDRELAQDRLDALHNYKYRNYVDNPTGIHVLLPNPDYTKDVSDSVKADVKDAGTRYLQGWSREGREWINTGINGASALSRSRLGRSAQQLNEFNSHFNRENTYFRNRLLER